MVARAYERKLDRDKPAGAIFALKNMGWSDRSEVHVSGGLANINLDLLPDHLLERIARGENALSVLASAAAPLLPGKVEVGTGGDGSGTGADE